MRLPSRWRKAWLAIGVVVLLSTPGVRAFASRYVDNSCANNGNGTAVGCAASPGGPGAYNNLQSALTAAVAGDVVIVRNNPSGGQDYVTATGSGYASAAGFGFANSGTSVSPITLTTYPGERPVLRACASGSTTLAACNRATLSAFNQSYIRITADACPTTGGTTLGFHVYGLVVFYDDSLTEAAMAHGNELSCVEVERGYAPADDGDWSGVQLHGQFGATVRGNLIHDVTAAGLTGAGAQGAITGVKLVLATNSQFRFNSVATVTPSTAGGFDCKADCVLNVFEYNDVRDVGVCINVETGETAGGPYTTNGATGSIIRNNVCVSSAASTQGAIRFADGKVTTLNLYNNTLANFAYGLEEVHPSANACQGITTYNTAFSGTTDAHVFLGDGTGTSCTLTRSDYHYFGTAASTPKYKYAGTAYNNLTDVVTGTAFEDHSVQVAEASFLFTSSGAGDYTLQGGSPLRNAGRFGGVSTGATTDVGAYVHGVTCVGYACAVSAVPSAATLVTVSAPLTSANPISAARLPGANTAVPNAVWATAGVEGGIPSATWTQCGSTISAYTGTATTINNAIAACGTNQYVLLGSGTFTLSTAIIFNESNHVLRGGGADQTKLVINGDTSGCGNGQNTAILFCSGTAHYGATAQGFSGPNHLANWTAGYPAGTSVITLSSTTGLAIGSTIALDQTNDASDGYPAAGDIFMCDAGEPCSWEGGNSFARTNRIQVELHKVTNIAGSNVTISPGVIANNYRSGQSPSAWWASAGVVLENSGIENLSIDFTGSGAVNILATNVTNCWFSGIRTVRTAGAGNFVFHLMIVNGLHTTVRNSYFYGSGTAGITQYGYTPHIVTLGLLENTIIQQGVTPIAPNDPEMASVYGYNLVTDSNADNSAAGFQLHNGGDAFNLYEGNTAGTFSSDVIHGTHHFLTWFRNFSDGHDHNPGGNNLDSAFAFWSHNRFFNLLGNVSGAASFTTYQTLNANCTTCIYNMQKGNHGGTLAYDARVVATMFRWGNWDNITSSNDNGTNDQTGTRWCGTAANTNWSACSSTSEVPSGITNYANSVPSAETLPNSFYLSAKPSWFGSVAWPPIGPDVTNSTVTSRTGGHANKIPARVCYESLADDPAYGGTLKVFNAATCYGS